MVQTCKYSNDMFRKYGCTALWDFPTWQYQALRGKGAWPTFTKLLRQPKTRRFRCNLYTTEIANTWKKSFLATCYSLETTGTSKDGKGWRYGPTLQTIFGSNYAGNQFHPRGVQPPQRIGFVLVTFDCISSSNLLSQKSMSISLTFQTRITKILLIDFGLDIFNMPFCFIYNPVT